MSQQKKRGPGRPPGSRNKVNLEKDIERAFKQGMSFTDIKMFIEKEMRKYSDAGDSKNAIGMVKHLIDLMKHLQKTYEDASDADEDEESEDESSGNVTPLRFGKKTK